MFVWGFVLSEWSDLSSNLFFLGSDVKQELNFTKKILWRNKLLNELFIEKFELVKENIEQLLEKKLIEKKLIKPIYLS